jgi:FkbM family methyltransferase
MNIKKVLSNILNEDGKIEIPYWVKKVKLDIGTSLSAPNSEIWLQREDNLMVFGFEPNPSNIKILNEGQNFWPHHIKKNRIGYSFFYIECALSNFKSESEKFYCTSSDNSGTSSLFKPKTFSINEIVDVPVITLEDFFDLFPWEKVPYIDQIKIDTQSSDFNVIKGIGKYLEEKIVYVDVETTTNGQYFSEENPIKINEYMVEKGFECLKWGINATFVNKRYKDILNQIDYFMLND